MAEETNEPSAEHAAEAKAAEKKAKEQRRWAAARACTRRVSDLPPLTMREELARLAEAPVDLDVRGDRYGDGVVTQLEERVAGLLGKPAAVFFPTGTQAQQVALRIWAQRRNNPTVAMHPLAHPLMYERHAFSTLSGLRVIEPTRRPFPPTPDEIRGLDEPYGTLMLELPLREAGFLLPRWDELVEVTQVARSRGAAVHFDGARLWESTIHLGQSLPAIAGLADSVYVSFYKTLEGLAGAALAGPTWFVAEARAWRHRYGGNVFQQWPAALAALVGLETVLPKVPSYVEHARVVAEGLKRLPGARVNPDPPHTHQFQLWLPHPADQLDDAVIRLAEEEQTWFAFGWWNREPTGLALTEITVGDGALALTADDVEQIGLAVLARLGPVEPDRADD